MDYLKKLSSSLADEEFYDFNLTSKSVACNIYSPGAQCSEEISKRTSKAGDKLREIMKPLNFFSSKMGKNTSKDKMEVTTDDFEYIVQKLREENLLTHGGVKEIAMREKMRRCSTGSYPCTAKEKSKASGSSFHDNFLTRAARGAASSPPLIRVDEWNGSSRKLHKHGVFPMDDEEKSVLNNRCRTRWSETSDVLNNSLLSLLSGLDEDELDTDEDLYEESTPETKRILEHSKSRNFLLTVRQGTVGGKTEDKQLIVTIEDEDKIDDKEEKKSERSDSVEYKDNNISLRSIYSMEYPSKSFSYKNRTVNVKEVEFLSWPSSEND